jgi:hypothetical protein
LCKPFCHVCTLLSTCAKGLPGAGRLDVLFSIY